jgi:hypothetical protein
MTQAERIIEFMEEHGSITPMEAFNKLKITKLSTRISEMRASGMEIDGEKVTKKNKYGKTRFMRYTLRG